MPQKLRFLVLAGLLLTLGAGATAALTGEGDGHHSPCTRHSQCPGASAHYPATECAMPYEEASQEKPKEKCCCSPGKPCDNCPCKSKGDQANSTTGVAGAQTEAKEKCCCSPDKPCDNCPCKVKAEAVDDQADRDRLISGECGVPIPAGLAGFGFGQPMNGPAAGLTYPIPGMHTPIPFSVPPPPMMPQMQMPQMMPAPQMMQMPQMAQMLQTAASEPEREGKQYLVEMKLTQKDKTVGTPKLMVSEGKPAQMSTGTTHASLWTAGVPSNDFGHEGYQIDLVVNADKKGCVSLECWLSTSSPDAASGISALHESRCHTTQVAELGKAAKVLCGEHTLEVTVKEQSCEVVGGSTEPCEKPCTEEKCFEGCKIVDEPCFEAAGCIKFKVKKDCCKKVEQVRFEAPAPQEIKAPVSMTFTAVESQPCCEGKLRDLNPPAYLLKVCCGETAMTCEKFDLEMPGHAPLKVSCDGSRVKIAGGTLNAMADTICTGEEGVLQFDGHVRVISGKGKVDVDSGKVRIKLEMCDFIQK